MTAIYLFIYLQNMIYSVLHKYSSLLCYNLEVKWTYVGLYVHCVPFAESLLRVEKVFCAFFFLWKST